MKIHQMSFKPPLFITFICICLLFGAGCAPKAHAQLEEFTKVKLQTLDKITARTSTFIANVGNTVQFGPLYISIQACRKAPPIEKPESAAFLQIWQHPPHKKQSEWVFSGWMFASSPALSSMDHPIYDVWVLDCVGKKTNEFDEVPEIDLNPEIIDLSSTGRAKAKTDITDGASLSSNSADNAESITGNETLLQLVDPNESKPLGGPDIEVELLDAPF